MREIKFRAWNGADCIMLDWPALSVSPILFMNIIKCRSGYSDLMQYTGMTDKNGVDIYEGDVCRGYNQDYKDPDAVEVIGVISWNNFEGAYSFDEKGVDWMMDISSGLEVIGNIHQNPELIGDK